MKAGDAPINIRGHTPYRDLRIIIGIPWKVVIKPVFTFDGFLQPQSQFWNAARRCKNSHPLKIHLKKSPAINQSPHGINSLLIDISSWLRTPSMAEHFFRTQERVYYKGYIDTREEACRWLYLSIKPWKTTVQKTVFTSLIHSQYCIDMRFLLGIDRWYSNLQPGSESWVTMSCRNGIKSW